MPGALEQAGAAREPSTFAPLHTDRVFTGFWPNRSVLRDGATTEYQLRYGLGRQDSMWKGSYNSEVSPTLTLIRRPGSSVYNRQSIPPIRSFYSFHTFTLTDEAVHVLADTRGTAILDVTGLDGNTTLLTKATTNRAYFLGVGNTLYITDGVENKQIVFAAAWQANHLYHVGDRVSMNGSIWEVKGFEWLPTGTTTITSTTTGLKADVTTQGSRAYPANEPVQLFGTSVPNLNELSFPFAWQSVNEVVFSGLAANIPLILTPTSIGGYVASIRSAGGTSQGTAPSFAPTSLWMGDGQVLWKNMGPAASDWGVAGPQTAPIVSQSVIPASYPSWLHDTVYSRTTKSNIFAVVLTDSNNNIQVISQFGTTGASVPTWQTGSFASTVDGTVHWQNYGAGAWQANHGYGVDVIQVLATGSGGAQGNYYFIPDVIGTSGATPPASWPSAVGALQLDGTVTWKNIGPVLDWSANIGQNTAITGTTTILDPNGYIQTILLPGKTGSVSNQPTWNKVPGGLTQEQAQFQNGPGPGATWQNAGAYAAASTQTVQYGYAYQKGATGDISNISPLSISILRGAGNQVIVSGDPAPNAVVGDNIIIYRTLQGDAVPYQLAIIPTTLAGQRWQFIDNFPDSALNQNLPGQFGEGTPLPTVGAGPMAYHLGRTFVGVGNVVWVSSGPDAVGNGSSGNAGFDQFFTLQSKITRFWVTALGLIVFTVRDSYIFGGTAQESDPLYVKVYVPNLPLLSYDCFCEYMTSGYLYLGTRMVVKLDPGSGIVEVSFPVANYLLYDVSNYDPSSCYLTFNTEGSNETALYLSNGISEWLRMTLATAPETGSAWNPPAILSDGTSAVQSVEVLPGVFRLLIGPYSAGAIRQRDRKMATDNGRMYSVHSRFGSIAMADPGMLAGIAWMTLTTTIAGSAPELGALIGEIDNTNGAQFENVKRTRQDPPDLALPLTVRSDRHHFLQGQEPVWCRHFQFTIDWPAEDAFNELMTFTIVGQVIQEMRGS